MTLSKPQNHRDQALCHEQEQSLLCHVCDSLAARNELSPAERFLLERVAAAGQTRGPRKSRRRRGVIFVTALWVILILGVMTLLFARAMRTELVAAQNRSGSTAADATLQGGIAYVLAVLDAYTPTNATDLGNTPGDALAILNAPGEAIQVGNTSNGSQPAGYFWIIRSNPDDFQNYYYGITDESSKLYLNTATSDELLQLPYMDETISDPILDWIDADSTTKANGAESDYYQSLPRPYAAKNAPFESVEELLLVKGFEINVAANGSIAQQQGVVDGNVRLWGNDLNHNGVIDANESAASNMMQTNSTGIDPSCGIIPFLSVWGTQPNNDSTGKARTNVSTTTTGGGAAGGGGGGGGGPGGGGNQVNQALITALTTAQITQQHRTNQIAQRAAGQTFTSVFDFIQKTAVQDEEAKLILDVLTTSTSKTLTGMVNINTAPLGVIQLLPGLQPGDAQDLIAVRHQSAQSITGGSGMEWMIGQVSPATLGRVGRYITGHSYQYSADIVAVSADGQSFRHVRIVVDAQTSPAKIIYRKDLTSLGWPLPAEIRQAMRDGTFSPGSTAPGMTWQP